MSTSGSLLVYPVLPKFLAMLGQMINVFVRNGSVGSDKKLPEVGRAFGKIYKTVGVTLKSSTPAKQFISIFFNEVCNCFLAAWILPNKNIRSYIVVPCCCMNYIENK